MEIEVKKSDKINFANNKPPLQKVGEFLKEARQGRNLTIEELSSSLRIGEEQLIAIESGDESSLPEKVFIRAMIRRIAEKLNLDVSFILDELNEKSKKNTIYTKVTKKEFPLEKRKFNPMVLIIISGLLGLLSSYIALKYFNKNTKTSINLSRIELISIKVKQNIFI